jgi:hypothetical protein
MLLKPRFKSKIRTSGYRINGILHYVIDSYYLLNNTAINTRFTVHPKRDNIQTSHFQKVENQTCGSTRRTIIQDQLYTFSHEEVGRHA